MKTVYKINFENLKLECFAISIGIGSIWISASNKFTDIISPSPAIHIIISNDIVIDKFFYINGTRYRPDDSDYYQTVGYNQFNTFEDFFNLLNSEQQKEILFHLDLFT